MYFSTSEEFQLIRTLPQDIVQGYLALRGKIPITWLVAICTVYSVFFLSVPHNIQNHLGMPIWLKNLQRAVRLNEHLLQFHCTFLLNAARAEKFDVSIACVDNREIRNLNRIYRNINAPTDVLSFPYHEVRSLTRFKRLNSLKAHSPGRYTWYPALSRDAVWLHPWRHHFRNASNCSAVCSRWNKPCRQVDDTRNPRPLPPHGPHPPHSSDVWSRKLQG